MSTSLEWPQITEEIFQHCHIAILFAWVARGIGTFLKDLAREKTVRGVASDVVMLLPHLLGSWPGFQMAPLGNLDHVGCWAALNRPRATRISVLVDPNICLLPYVSVNKKEH